jgi:hypothetical protein
MPVRCGRLGGIQLGLYKKRKASPKAAAEAANSGTS